MAAETNLLVVLVAAVAVLSVMLAGAGALPAAVAVAAADGADAGLKTGASEADQMVATANASGNTSAPSTAARKVRLKDYVSEGGGGGRASVALQSVLTFFTVFVLCCVAILAVFVWRRFSDSTLRVPLPYQYSALSQFEQDADDDVNDLDDDLHIMAEDSSSDGEAKADEDDDDVFVTKISDGGAPAMLRVSECRESSATSAVSRVSLSSAAGRKASSTRTQSHSSSSLMDEAPDESLVN